ncbi:MAG: PAS domain S-box protein [Desulfofustis sp.]|nr:PAS domain S-box protein [Desulfofustis sp.]
MSFWHRLYAFLSAGNFIWIGFGIGFLYWILESFLHMLFFGGSRFAEELITPDLHEIWKRLLVITLLALFGVFAQQYFILRQRSENAIKESERKYRTIFEQATNPIFLFDDEGRFVDNNHAALMFLECSQEDLVAKSFMDITAGLSPTECTKELSDKDDHWMLEIDYRIGGNTKTMLLNLVPLSGGMRNFIYGIGQDISERKRMEQVLKQAHAELDQIFQTASVGMRVIDTDFNVVKINRTFAVMANLNEADAVNKKCYEIFSGPMCHTAACPINRVLKGETNVETYVDKERSDGKLIPCILAATPFIDPIGEIIGIVESFRDITQLKNAHEIISSERDKLHSILSHLLEGVSIINTNHTIEYQNQVFMDDFGDCMGKACYSVFRKRTSPCTPCCMQEAITSGHIQHVEYETVDGRSYEQAYTRITDIDGEEKAVAFIRDISEKKNSLAIAMHAERLAAVGELAAGVAHEINNPITGIINYAQIISNKSKEDDMINDVARRMVKEGNRIARIVEGLLTFSRRRHDDKVVVSANDIVADALTLTSAQMRKDSIILKINLAESLPKIMVQAHEIEQVFINIISNARYALNEKYPEPDSDKVLEISSRSTTVGDCPQVEISFLDHGTGIAAAIIDQVITPFFSTKMEGKRTGLGLSISHGILENHNGKLAINSMEGRYTRMTVTLPAWQDTTQ